MIAQLQQRSIYDWAQSEHQSAASRTGVVVATRSHIILMLPCRRSSHGDSYSGVPELAVVRPRPKGEQSQALGTYLGGSQSMKVRCSPGYFLIFLVSGGTQFVLFCSVDSLLSFTIFDLSSFVFSFCVFCPRGLSALRAASFSRSSARVHVVWDSYLRFIWCHPFGRGCCGITAKQRFI